MRRRDIIKAYEQGRDAVIDLVLNLVSSLRELEGENDTLRNENVALKEESLLLEERVKAFEEKAKKNSRNSNLPPSSDGFKRKTRTRRKKSGRSPGGQKGHPGKTLLMVENPDKVVVHPVAECDACGKSLLKVEPAGCESRQVFDLPPVRLLVTEYRSQVKCCPSCGHETKASFPPGVKKPVCYGPDVKALATYLVYYQHLPYKRASDLLSDILGHRVSEGTLVNMCAELFSSLEPVEDAIKDGLLASPAINVDETGTRIDAAGFWLHVASTDALTSYFVHPKRGRKATDEMGILPTYEGTAIHDCWKPYFGYECHHALCCAHLLRELTGLLECDPSQQWASGMIELLLDVKAEKDKRMANGYSHLTKRFATQSSKRYDDIVDKGLSANPIVANVPGKRGRKKKTIARNLLERFREHKEWVLAFARDFSVNFDNNLAERDLRMAKLQQKISGCFRSFEGAQAFCRARGYISTMRKNSFPTIEALRLAFEGTPVFPSPP